MPESMIKTDSGNAHFAKAMRTKTVVLKQDLKLQQGIVQFVYWQPHNRKI